MVELCMGFRKLFFLFLLFFFKVMWGRQGMLGLDTSLWPPGRRLQIPEEYQRMYWSGSGLRHV